MSNPHSPGAQPQLEPGEGPQVGDVIDDKYRVEQLLGRGGMGVVLQATHTITGKRFAIKWLLPDRSGDRQAIDRFIREAQVAGYVDHPNVVEVYDIGKTRGSFYMVMELLAGESLEGRLLSRGPLTVRDAVRIILPCAQGIARAHAAGIVHRDLKPANIFLRRAPHGGAETPKVLDFGISKMADAILPHSSITKTGTLLGTPYYMAPEQVHAKEVDARTDIYALGVILYQLVSGKLPFDAPSFSSLLVKILTEVPEPLESCVPGVPPSFARLVRRAMARDPAARFQTMHAMISALERVDVDNERPGSRSRRRDASAAPHARARSDRARGRSGRNALIAGLCLAALLGVGWFSYTLLAPQARRTPAGEAVQQDSPAAPEPAPPLHATEPATPATPTQPQVDGDSLPRGLDVPHDIAPVTNTRRDETRTVGSAIVAAPAAPAPSPTKPSGATTPPRAPSPTKPSGATTPPRAPSASLENAKRADRAPTARPVTAAQQTITPPSTQSPPKAAPETAAAPPPTPAERETEPPAPEPAADHQPPKATGRLGISLNKDDF